MVQTSRKSHPSLDAPENVTLQTETAAARGINDSSRRTDFTVSPYGPGRTTTLTSQSSTLGEFMLMIMSISSPGKPNIWWSLPFPHPESRCSAKGPGTEWTTLFLRLHLWLIVVNWVVSIDQGRVQICWVAWTILWNLHSMAIPHWRSCHTQPSPRYQVWWTAGLCCLCWCSSDGCSYASLHSTKCFAIFSRGFQQGAKAGWARFDWRSEDKES